MEKALSRPGYTLLWSFDNGDCVTHVYRNEDLTKYHVVVVADGRVITSVNTAYAYEVTRFVQRCYCF